MTDSLVVQDDIGSPEAVRGQTDHGDVVEVGRVPLYAAVDPEL